MFDILVSVFFVSLFALVVYNRTDLGEKVKSYVEKFLPAVLAYIPKCSVCLPFWAGVLSFLLVKEYTVIHILINTVLVHFFYCLVVIVAKKSHE